MSKIFFGIMITRGLGDQIVDSINDVGDHLENNIGGQNQLLSCFGREPTWDEYLDFDNDCNRRIEVLGDLDAIWIWVILFILFVVGPIVGCVVRFFFAKFIYLFIFETL